MKIEPSKHLYVNKNDVKCCFCGKTVSIKYRVLFEHPKDTSQDVWRPCCNRCALMIMGCKQL